eukprot:g45427.t1
MTWKLRKQIITESDFIDDGNPVEKEIEESVDEPEVQAAASPEAEAATEQESETAAQVESPDAAENETADEPDVEITAEPDTAAAEPHAEATAQPDEDAAAEPDAEATAESEREATAEPETEATIEPETETAAEPDSEKAAEQESEPKSEPDVQSAVEAESELLAKPETELTVEDEPSVAATVDSAVLPTTDIGNQLSATPSDTTKMAQEPLLSEDKFSTCFEDPYVRSVLYMEKHNILQMFQVLNGLASVAFFGNEFHRLITLWLKKFVLFSIMTGHPFTLRLCPQDLVAPTRGDIFCMSTSSKSLTI